MMGYVHLEWLYEVAHYSGYLIVDYRDKAANGVKEDTNRNLNGRCLILVSFLQFWPRFLVALFMALSLAITEVVVIHEARETALLPHGATEFGVVDVLHELLLVLLQFAGKFLEAFVVVPPKLGKLPEHEAATLRLPLDLRQLVPHVIFVSRVLWLLVKQVR